MKEQDLTTSAQGHESIRTQKIFAQKWKKFVYILKRHLPVFLSFSMVSGLCRLLRTSIEPFLTSSDRYACSASNRFYRATPQWIPGSLMVVCGTVSVFKVFRGLDYASPSNCTPYKFVPLCSGHTDLLLPYSPFSLPSFPFAPCSSCLQPNFSRQPHLLLRAT